jgi:hypothetical protein
MYSLGGPPGSAGFALPLRNVTPFALAGVGVLIFDPSDFAGASTQTRAALLWGWCAYQLVASHFHARGIPRFCL